MAAALGKLGVGTGDRVTLWLRNGAEYVAAYYGSLMAGAVTVPVNVDTGIDELLRIVAVTESKALFTERSQHATLRQAVRLPPLVSTVPSEHPVVHATFSELVSTTASGSEERPVEESAPASIFFTSGSTGEPKGVVLSHANVVSNTRSIVEYLRLDSPDRVLAILPFSYVYGKSLLNTHFCVGGSVVVESFAFLGAVLNAMQTHQVTGFAGVPTTFHILLARSEFREWRFPALRYLSQAGGPMAPAVIRRVAEAFPGKELFIMYGATEATARLTYLPPSRLFDKLGSVGIPIPGVRIEVQHEDGTPASVGDTGEVVAFGPNIMLGYWRDPETTAEALRGGGYHTGDLGYLDRDGYLYIVGRRDDLMKIGGHRISARQIEEVFYELEGVQEAAIVPVPDAVLGQTTCVFVVPKQPDELNREEVLEHCRRRLGNDRTPRYIDFLNALPKNENGKVAREALRRRAQSSLAGRPSD